jgi:hypothetical protein
MLRGLAVLLIAFAVSGCASGDFGWANDPERSYQFSGFSVRAPSGSNWSWSARNPDSPNSILFTKVDQTPFFKFTTAGALGIPIGAPVPHDSAKDVLTKILQQYQQQSGLIVEKSSFETPIEAQCLRYQGKLAKRDLLTVSGVVRIEAIRGYFCLHPDYDDFVVMMETRNGTVPGITQSFSWLQVENFFNSLRFTPRNIPKKPPGPPSKSQKRELA